MVKNWFTYSDTEAPFYGVANCDCCASDIVADTLPVYTQVHRFHDSCWVLGNQKGSYDLFVKGKLCKTQFIKHDILALGNAIGFLQLDTLNTRSLICIEMLDTSEAGLFVPKDINDFKKWFYNRFVRYGYEGALNEMRVSDVFVIYFEVLQCIFETANYVPVAID